MTHTKEFFYPIKNQRTISKCDRYFLEF